MSLDVLAELESAGAVYTDKHFIYTSGKHGSAYINMDPLFPHVSLVSELCNLLINPFLDQVDTVAAPATGGIALGVLAGRAFVDAGQEVKAVWADKDGKDFVFARAGFIEQIKNKRVLVVEDLLNTGGSVEKVCRLVERHGGELVGASVVCNRGASTTETLGVKRLESLVKVTLEVFEPDACPLCENNTPIVEDIGHGDKYKVDHADYPGGYVRLIG